MADAGHHALKQISSRLPSTLHRLDAFDRKRDPVTGSKFRATILDRRRCFVLRSTLLRLRLRRRRRRDMNRDRASDRCKRPTRGCGTEAYRMLPDRSSTKDHFAVTFMGSNREGREELQ